VTRITRYRLTVTVISAAIGATLILTASLIWNLATPAQPQTVSAVGYTHADLIDDPCPTNQPACTNHRNQPVPIDWFYPIEHTTGLNPAVFQFSDGNGSSYGGHPIPEVFAGGADRIPATNPLIVFSHGTAGHGMQNEEYYRDLAEQGFIVAAPTHRGNSLIDVGLGLPIDGFATTINKRHQDMLFATTITNALFGSKVQRDQYNDPYVVTIGHSLGAMTALTTPTGINAYLQPDARVDAAVAISASPYLYDVAGIPTAPLLGSLHKPVLLISQLADGISPHQYTARVATELTGSPQVDGIGVWGAEHNATTSLLLIKTDLDASTTPQVAKDAVTGLADQVCADYAPDCQLDTHEQQLAATLAFLDDVL
jgi:pimeloyl-ACP methyl ester carboxylesterase